MPDSDYDVAAALLLRREAGDCTPITYREAQALCEMKRRAERLDQIEDLRPRGELQRLGFQGIELSKYMQSVMQMEGL